MMQWWADFLDAQFAKGRLGAQPNNANKINQFIE